MSIAAPDRASEPITADDLFPISVEDYHAMIEAGILRPDDHVELLEGLLVRNTDRQPQSYCALLSADDSYHRFSVAQYDELVRLNIIDEDDPVELLDGLLIRKMGKNPPHRIVKKLLEDALQRLIPGGWYVDTQEPITLATSEPEPDLMIIRGDPRDHLPHPMPASIGLLIEIAESTLERDRRKKRVYAAASIPVYWIVNLIDNVVEVYTGATNGDYAKPTVYRSGDQVPLMLDGITIGSVDVASFLTWSR